MTREPSSLVLFSLMKGHILEIRQRCTRRMCDQTRCITVAKIEKPVGKLKPKYRALYKLHHSRP